MSTDLVLPGSITETGLDLPRGLSFDEWEETGKTLGRIGRACQWWIGDWLNYGERAYGEKYTQAMDVTGLDYETLRGYAWVAARIETVRRQTVSSFSHHAAVAALDPPEQDAYLTEAAENGWPVSELRKQIKTTNEDKDKDHSFCPTCGHRVRKDQPLIGRKP